MTVAGYQTKKEQVSDSKAPTKLLAYQIYRLGEESCLWVTGATFMF